LVATSLIFSHLICQSFFLIDLWILETFLINIAYLAFLTIFCIKAFKRALRKKHYLTLTLKTAFLYINFTLSAVLIRCLLFYFVKSSKWFNADYLIKIFFEPNKISLLSSYCFAYFYSILRHYSLKSYYVLPYI
jgi:hypothetical protein